MPYGYLGTTPNQQLKNSGVFSVEEALALKNLGELGGSLEHIETQTVSGVTTVDFQSIGNFDVHFLTLNNMESSTTNIRYSLRFYESGTLETSSVYKWAFQQQLSNGTGSEFYDDSHSSIPVQLEQPTGFNSGGYTYLYNLTDSALYSSTSNQHIRVSNAMIAEFGGGVMTQASVVDGFQISGYDSSTPSFSGTLKLYGVKQI